jgi:hypothetical protein
LHCSASSRPIPNPHLCFPDSQSGSPVGYTYILLQLRNTWKLWQVELTTDESLHRTRPSSIRIQVSRFFYEAQLPRPQQNSDVEISFAPTGGICVDAKGPLRCSSTPPLVPRQPTTSTPGMPFGGSMAAWHWSLSCLNAATALPRQSVCCSMAPPPCCCVVPPSTEDPLNSPHEQPASHRSEQGPVVVSCMAFSRDHVGRKISRRGGNAGCRPNEVPDDEARQWTPR